MSSTQAGVCPVHPHADTRKSGPLAQERAKPDEGARRVMNAGLAQAVLRSAESKQAGAGAEMVVVDNPEHAPVFFLDGLAHHKKRLALASYFTPRAVTTRQQSKT